MIIGNGEVSSSPFCVHLLFYGVTFQNTGIWCDEVGPGGRPFYTYSLDGVPRHPKDGVPRHPLCKFVILYLNTFLWIHFRLWFVGCHAYLNSFLFKQHKRFFSSFLYRILHNVLGWFYMNYLALIWYLFSISCYYYPTVFDIKNKLSFRFQFALIGISIN